jgi:hypothetical protein
MHTFYHKFDIHCFVQLFSIMSDEKQCESPTTGQGPIVMYYVNNGIYGDFNTAVVVSSNLDHGEVHNIV